MMKNFIVSFTILMSLFVSFSSADISIGLDGGYETSSNTDEDGTGGTYESSYGDMLLTPYLSIKPSDIVEISIGVPIGYYKMESIDKDSDGEKIDHSKSTNFRIGGRVGGYFHLIREDHIHLSTGPEFTMLFATEPTEYSLNADGDLEEEDSQYETYSDMEMDIHIPLNLDYYISDAFGFRFSFNILGLEFDINKSELDGGGSTETTDKSTNFYLLGKNFDGPGMVLPDVGIFINF